MINIKTVIFVALSGSASFTFLMLACALPVYGVWWPMFVLIFYALAPIPTFIAQRFQDTNNVDDLCAFLTTVIVFSAYGLPVLLARVSKIMWGACALTLTANTAMFAVLFWILYLMYKDDEFGF